MARLHGWARPTRLAAVVAAIVALGATGCGGDDSRQPTSIRHPVARAVESLQSAFVSRDIGAICRAMSSSAQRQAGTIAHSKPTTCENDVRKVFAGIDKGGGWGDGAAPLVTAVSTKGRTATATLETDGFMADVPFVKQEGAWKLHGFFGVTPRQLRAVEKAAPRRPSPAASGTAIAVLHASGSDCPRPSSASYPRVSGGCEIAVSGERVPIIMLTPFGDFEFGECSLSYRVLMDGRGRAWIDSWTSDGPQQGGCSDLNPCITSDYEYQPWKGRVRVAQDGELILEMDMCLRTCVGSFRGAYVVRLVPDDDAWRVEPSDLGRTGFRVDGALDTRTPEGFEVRLP